MTATPLKDASPQVKLATLAARRAGSISDDQRAALDKRAAALVAEAGGLADAGLVVAAYTVTESAGATLSAFSAAVAAFTADPLPAVREGDDKVEQPIVFKLIRTALDLGTDALAIGKDVDRVIALYRSAFFASGTARDPKMVEALPQSILEDVLCQDVVDCYTQLAFEHFVRRNRDSAVSGLARCKKHLSSKETQIEDLGDVLSDIACARAGSAEALGAMFDLGKLDDLMHECDQAVGKAGITRSTAVLEKMVALMPETPGGNVTAFAETLEDFRDLAKPIRGWSAPKPDELDPDAVF